MNSLSDVWNILLERLQKDLSPTTINTWFDQVKVVTMEDSALVLHCSNAFKKETIEKLSSFNKKEEALPVPEDVCHPGGRL